MSNEAVLTTLEALAQEHRLAIIEFLLEHSPEAFLKQTIAERVGMPDGSTNFHIFRLEAAGLVRSSRRRGRVVYSISPEAVTRAATLVVETFGQLKAAAAELATVPVRSGERRLRSR